MVSGPESKLKRSLNNLLHIWLLLCVAAVLVFFLYFNRLTTHTSMQYTSGVYRLYDRQCVEIVDFHQPEAWAPFYYALWVNGQGLMDGLHDRSLFRCHKISNSIIK
jgi:hypothetical protein